MLPKKNGSNTAQIALLVGVFQQDLRAGCLFSASPRDPPDHIARPFGRRDGIQESSESFPQFAQFQGIFTGTEISWRVIFGAFKMTGGYLNRIEMGARTPKSQFESVAAHHLFLRILIIATSEYIRQREKAGYFQGCGFPILFA
jgi:hypothetical protein